MKNIRKLIHEAFKEDSIKNDITSKCVFSDKIIAKANLLVKERGIICGMHIADEVLKEFDSSLETLLLCEDGQLVRKGQIIAEIKGAAHSILSCERTLLNFLQHLSGVATITRQFVDKVKDTKIKIYDTRKTLPGLRELEKYAVRCGGGCNHRVNLEEMAMIKDNHLKVIGNIKDGVEKIKQNNPDVKVEVECQSIYQIQQAIESGADIIMLDNMSFLSMQEATELIRKNKTKKIEIEVSGGVNLKTIETFTNLDIDRISIGALTHSAPSLDISLEIVD
ncbi:MAG: carboxylating nicotinate-nucleotide diphosphorylase [Endomicrobiales bacterium]|nr:carboxylating nicotinate-nucleotide diphosphorylase [Endomicrobiales bacterium]